MTIREQLEEIRMQEVFDSLFAKEVEDVIKQVSKGRGYVIGKTLDRIHDQGTIIGINKMIKAMYNDNMPLETIAKITDLDLKEVKDMVKKENSNLIEQLAQMDESEIIKTYFAEDEDKDLMQQAIEDYERLLGNDIDNIIRQRASMGIYRGKLVIIKAMNKENIPIERIAKIVDMELKRVKNLIDIV